MTTTPDEPTGPEPTEADLPAETTGSGAAGATDATDATEVDDELHARFDAFRTLDTPAPPPVAELPAVRAPLVARWPAVAAALLVVTLLLVGTVVASGNRTDELSTTGPPATDPGTTTTTRPPTTSTSTSTTTTVESTTTTDTTAAIPPTTVTVPVTVATTVGPTLTDPLTPGPRVPSEPPAPRNLVPPATIPQGPRPPTGQWLLEWEKAYDSPVARRSDTSFTVNARYDLCSYGKNPFDSIKPPSVIETADAVVVTFWADSPVPPVIEPGPQDCPHAEFNGASPTYVVQLSAPLGDRWVYDGRPWAPPYGPHLEMDPNFRAD